MKKRILCLAVTLCLLIALLPVTALAEETNPEEINFSYAQTYPALPSKGRQVKAGTTTYYKTTDSKYLTVGSANNWSVKLEYPTTGAATLTLKDLDLDSAVGLIFGSNYTKFPSVTPDCNVPLNIILIGENKIRTIRTSANNDTNYNCGSLDLYTTGDVTISGEGSLSVIASTSSTKHGAITSFGNLTLDNVDVDITCPDDYGYASGISSVNGNMVIKGGSLNIVSVNDSSATGFGGYANNNETLKYIFNVGGNLTFQDKAKITTNVALYNNAFNVGGTITISNSDIELGNTKTTSLFASNVAPTIIFDGEYTVVGSTTGCSLNADFSLKPNSVKTVDLNAINVTTLRYLKITHVCVAENDNDCTTADKCGFCGIEMVPAQPAHTPEADDGDVTTAVKCSVCGKVVVEAQAPATPPAFDKVQVVAGNDLTLNYRISKAEVEAAGGTQVKIERATAAGAAEPKFVPLTEATVEDGFYVIPFTGIAAKEMGDEIAMTVCNAEGEAVSVTRQDSILQYALRMLEGDDAKLKTLIVDMLNYGAMAQDVFDYNEENFVSTALTDEQKALGTQQMAACAANKATVTAAEGFTADVYQGTSFILNNNIAMAMRMSAELGDGSYAKVTFTNYLNKDQEEVTVNAQKLTDGTYAYIYNGLVAADGRCMVTWEFYKADHTKVATVEDSMEQYVGRNVEALPYLAQLMNYSDAAYAYFTAE